jgi:hypothetical protein
MNISRVVCLTAAVIISAIQWAPLFYPAIYTQSIQAAAAPRAYDASDLSLPGVVVVAHR